MKKGWFGNWKHKNYASIKIGYYVANWGNKVKHMGDEKNNRISCLYYSENKWLTLLDFVGN